MVDFDLVTDSRDFFFFFLVEIFRNSGIVTHISSLYPRIKQVDQIIKIRVFMRLKACLSFA